MKSIFIFSILFTFNISFSQKIEGTYKYEPVSKKGEFEIEIKNDSTYIVKSNGSTSEVKGKIKRKKGKFYSLIQYDSVAKIYGENLVKITRTKMVFYGYKQIRPGKITRKPVKAFTLKKASLPHESFHMAETK